MKKVLKKFSTVFIVKGFNRSMIIDPFRSTYFYISNYMAEMLSKYNDQPIPEENFNQDHETLKFLLENDLIFYCNENLSNNFPEYPLDHMETSVLSNAVIEIDNIQDKTLMHIFELVYELGCKNFLLISKNSSKLGKIDLFFELIKGKVVDCVDIYLNYSLEGLNHAQEKIIPENPNCRLILFFNANRKEYIYSGYKKMQNIFLSPNELNLQANSKKFKNFNFNISHYTESLIGHTYFRKKIFINSLGKVYQSPHTLKCFGNVNSFKTGQELYQSLLKESFFKLGSILKEDSDVCDNCENRRICIDKRFPIKKPNVKRYYFAEECDYNPFISKWKGEPGYLSLKDSGIISDSKKYEYQEDFLKTINEDLWN